MPTIMADHDVEGHVHVLLRLLLSDEWYPLWTEMGYTVVSFESLGLPTTTSDVELWQLCQAQQIVLITGNRNKDGPRSLEATIQHTTQHAACQC
jgi:hypothetical protein